MLKPRIGRGRVTTFVLAAAALGVAPSGAVAQEAGLPQPAPGESLPQQAQETVPEDWPARLGVCRRTVSRCQARSLRATRLEPGESVGIDGRLDEAIWQRAVWSADFIQREPIEGSRPRVRTEVAIAYDETNLYVAGKNFDPDPSAIRANLARRDDNGESDRFKVSIDSYGNRQTYYTFSVTAAGGRVDYFGQNDQDFNRDYSYDPIWEADARITDEGWIAEMAIPFSQLRFNQAEEVIFGINVNRYRPGDFEDLFWVSVPKDENGWTSWFGDLTGLEGVKTRRPIEFVPYVASGVALTSDELVNPDNPFSEESEFDGRIGADLKMGIGSGLTLDATINPDFGQVEADPAEVNLSAFPTFFQERRPFFVENADLLEANDLFFSRRIGARPHGSPGGTFADVPASSTILGAAKLTGRTGGGLSLGALGAVTAEESADFYDEPTDTFGRSRVEPATGWLVLRGLQEFGPAKSTAGLALTAVRRDLSNGEPLAALLNEEAYAFGADATLRFRGGLTELTGIIQGSHISGMPEAITRVQRFSSHYFQRPDAGHVEFDPTRTSLSGYRAYLDFEHSDGQNWSLESSVLAVSPGFDINDAGALGRADRIRARADVSYRENTVGTLRSWNARAEVSNEWNFDGDRLETWFELGGEVGLLNFWRFGAELDYSPPGVSDTRTRGGPLMGTPGAVAYSAFFNSPFQSRLQVRGNVTRSTNDLGGSTLSARLDLQYRPGGAWQFAAGPHYSHSVNVHQYVGTEAGGRPETFGNRYIFGRIDRHTLSAQFRANYAFNPDLSLEAYFEPFAATGSYSDYGELSEPGSRHLRFYGVEPGTTISESTGDAPRLVTVTDGTDEFSFFREDFRALSFRSNLVMRWEWLPGSTLFLVWQVDRGRFTPETDPSGASVGDLFDSPGEPGQNFFAVKATYWLPL